MDCPCAARPRKVRDAVQVHPKDDEGSMIGKRGDPTAHTFTSTSPPRHGPPPPDDVELRKRRRRARFDAPAIRVAVLVHSAGGVAYENKVLSTALRVLSSNGRTARSTVAKVTGAEVRAGRLDGGDFDVLHVPGGSVFCQQRELGREGFAKVLRFVGVGGGGYVGVCAGALLAAQQGYGTQAGPGDDDPAPGAGMLGAETAWTGWLPGNGKWTAVVRVAATGRAVLGGGGGRGVDTTPSAPARPGGGMTKTTGAAHPDGAVGEAAADEEVAMVLSGGSWHVPAFTTNSVLGIDVPAFTPLCTFVRIEKQSGAEVPPVEWGDAVPAVAGQFGQGRVVVFGPHPESPRSDAAAQTWFGEAVHWASRKGIDAP